MAKETDPTKIWVCPHCGDEDAKITREGYHTERESFKETIVFDNDGNTWEANQDDVDYGGDTETVDTDYESFHCEGCRKDFDEPITKQSWIEVHGDEEEDDEDVSLESSSSNDKSDHDPQYNVSMRGECPCCDSPASKVPYEPATKGWTKDKDGDWWCPAHRTNGVKQGYIIEAEIEAATNDGDVGAMTKTPSSTATTKSHVKITIIEVDGTTRPLVGMFNLATLCEALRVDKNFDSYSYCSLSKNANGMDSRLLYWPRANVGMDRNPLATQYLRIYNVDTPREIKGIAVLWEKVE